MIGAAHTNHGEREITFRSFGGSFVLGRILALPSGRFYYMDSATVQLHALSRQQLTGLRTLFVHGEASCSLPPGLETAGTALRFPIGTLPKEDDAELPAQILIVNPTEQCNLRCTYCYFSGGYSGTRLHRPVSLARQTLAAALEHFVRGHVGLHGIQKSVYFFGGEPLLNWRLIEYGVSTLDRLCDELGVPRSDYIVQIATNGLLLDSEKLHFLESHGVYCNVSYDGPSHDATRITKGGNGTAAAVRQKVEDAYSNFPEYFRTHVGLSCVLSEPDSFLQLYEHFSAWQPALACLHLDFDVLLPGLDAPGFAPPEYRDALGSLRQDLWRYFEDTYSPVATERARSFLHFFTSGFNIVHRSLSRVYWRLQDPPESPGLMVTRIGAQSPPGLSAVTLGSDGALFASYERQSPWYTIGNATNWIDAQRVRELTRDFEETTDALGCARCWAAPFCGIDFNDVLLESGNTRAHLGSFQDRCAAERADIEMALKTHINLSEKHGSRYEESQVEEASTSALATSWVPFAAPEGRA